eukprot:COSAG02_NODE_2141_length_9686_cov_3.045791_4_plen_85_part_00
MHAEKIPCQNHSADHAQKGTTKFRMLVGLRLGAQRTGLVCASTAQHVAAQHVAAQHSSAVRPFGTTTIIVPAAQGYGSEWPRPT